jgi:hypothetical protein
MAISDAAFASMMGLARSSLQTRQRLSAVAWRRFGLEAGGEAGVSIPSRRRRPPDPERGPDSEQQQPARFGAHDFMGQTGGEVVHGIAVHLAPLSATEPLDRDASSL